VAVYIRRPEAVTAAVVTTLHEQGAETHVAAVVAVVENLHRRGWDEDRRQPARKNGERYWK